MKLEEYLKQIERLSKKARENPKAETKLTQVLDIYDNYTFFVSGVYNSIIAKLVNLKKFSLDEEWNEAMSGKKVNTFLYNPGTVLVDVIEIKNKSYYIEDIDSLRGKTRKKMRDDYNIEFSVHPYQGMPRWSNLPPYPGKIMERTSNTIVLSEAIQHLILLIQDEGLPACFPRSFYHNSLEVDPRKVIFYEGRNKK